MCKFLIFGKKTKSMWDPRSTIIIINNPPAGPSYCTCQLMAGRLAAGIHLTWLHGRFSETLKFSHISSFDLFLSLVHLIHQESSGIPWHIVKYLNNLGYFFKLLGILQVGSFQQLLNKCCTYSKDHYKCSAEPLVSSHSQVPSIDVLR